MTEVKVKTPYRYLESIMLRGRKAGRWVSSSELRMMDDKELKRFAARIEMAVDDIKAAIEKAYPNGV